MPTQSSIAVGPLGCPLALSRFIRHCMFITGEIGALVNWTLRTVFQEEILSIDFEVASGFGSRTGSLNIILIGNPFPSHRRGGTLGVFRGPLG